MPLLDDLDQLDEAQDANHSPSTVTTALPTPHEFLTGPDQSPWPPPRIFTPAAPILKDLDSFTEGTGTGSFDCLPEITTPGELCAHPLTNYTLLERHVSQLDAEDHMQSIASWREDVHLELDIDVDVDHSSTTAAAAASLTIHMDSNDRRAVPLICKRPRSIASSDDGRKRIRVHQGGGAGAVGSSTSITNPLIHVHVQDMSCPPPLIPRRPRTISAPPLYHHGGSIPLS